MCVRGQSKMNEKVNVPVARRKGPSFFSVPPG